MNTNTTVCDVAKEKINMPLEEFFPALARSIGLDPREIRVDPKRLLLSNPNWVIKEFLDRLSLDVASMGL